MEGSTSKRWIQALDMMPTRGFHARFSAMGWIQGHPLPCIAWFVSTYLKLGHLGCKSSIIFIGAFIDFIPRMYCTKSEHPQNLSGLQYIAVSGFEQMVWIHHVFPMFHRGLGGCQDGMGFACHHLLVYSKAGHSWKVALVMVSPKPIPPWKQNTAKIIVCWV